MNKKINKILFLALCFLLVGCGNISNTSNSYGEKENKISSESMQLENIPEYDGNSPYIVLNDNIPNFSDKEKQSIEVVEIYSELDEFGRCGTAFANLHISNMPTEDREGIGQIKPTGWVTSKYDFVDGKYLYNRCHLIGFQLAGENANNKNLITGTRYLNVDGMLPFENMVADYLKETGNHVLYRVTPIFIEDELIARGVQIEAYSVEDNGEGISFNIYCYNNQPGVSIEYTTGENKANGDNTEKDLINNKTSQMYVLNTNSKKFHTEDCSNANKISDENKIIKETTINQLNKDGYQGAKCCIR